MIYAPDITKDTFKINRLIKCQGSETQPRKQVIKIHQPSDEIKIGFRL